MNYIDIHHVYHSTSKNPTTARRHATACSMGTACAAPATSRNCQPPSSASVRLASGGAMMSSVPAGLQQPDVHGHEEHEGREIGQREGPVDDDLAAQLLPEEAGGGCTHERDNAADAGAAHGVREQCAHRLPPSSPP